MGNKRREGLSHFPLDVDIFEDEKLYYAEELVDANGYDQQLRVLIDKVLIRLYCLIYKNGYQVPWDHRMRIAATQKIGNGMNITLLEKIVKAMVTAGLFNQEMFDNKHVLTSKRIQETWIDVVYRARRVHQTLNPDYKLLTDQEIKMIRSGKKLTATGNLIPAAETQQSATDSTSRSGSGSSKTLLKSANQPKNVTDSVKNAAEKQKRNTNKNNNTPENVDNSHQIQANDAETIQSVTENEKNDAESGKPFTLILSNNNSNKSILDSNSNNSTVIIANNGENVAGNEETATESTKTATESELADVKMVIPPGDKLHYPIEICLYNITHPYYSRTFEQICMDHHLSPEQFQKWALAFNRMLIKKSDFKRPMVGNDSWSWYLGNWIKTNDDWVNIDPDTLYVKYGSRKQTAAGTGGTATIPGSKASEEEKNNFYKPREYPQKS